MDKVHIHVGRCNVDALGAQQGLELGIVGRGDEFEGRNSGGIFS